MSLITSDKLTNKINGFTDTSGKQNAVVGVYIGTNEKGTDQTAMALKNFPRLDEACHIGFSSWHNFDIIVQRQSRRAILCDFNPYTREFLLYTLMCAEKLPSRHQCAKALEKLVRDNSLKFSLNVETDKWAEEEVIDELNRPGSWLSTDDGFNYIKKLASQGKISVITIDIRDHEKFKRIANLMVSNAQSIDTVYVSNINVYMSTPGCKQSFLKTIDYLTTFETKLIYCQNELKQVVVIRNQILDKEGKNIDAKYFFTPEKTTEEDMATSISTPKIEEVEEEEEEEVTTGFAPAKTVEEQAKENTVASSQIANDLLESFEEMSV